MKKWLKFIFIPYLSIALISLSIAYSISWISYIFSGALSGIVFSILIHKYNPTNKNKVPAIYLTLIILIIIFDSITALKNEMEGVTPDLVFRFCAGHILFITSSLIMFFKKIAQQSSITHS